MIAQEDLEKSFLGRELTASLSLSGGVDGLAVYSGHFWYFGRAGLQRGAMELVVNGSGYTLYINDIPYLVGDKEIEQKNTLSIGYQINPRTIVQLKRIGEHDCLEEIVETPSIRIVPTVDSLGTELRISSGSSELITAPERTNPLRKPNKNTEYCVFEGEDLFFNYPKRGRVRYKVKATEQEKIFIMPDVVVIDYEDYGKITKTLFSVFMKGIKTYETLNFIGRGLNNTKKEFLICPANEDIKNLIRALRKFEQPKLLEFLTQNKRELILRETDTENIQYQIRFLGLKFDLIGGLEGLRIRR
jgi:hypothetical protein